VLSAEAGVRRPAPPLALDAGAARHLDKRMRRELGLDAAGGGGGEEEGGAAAAAYEVVDAGALRGDWQAHLAANAEAAAAAAAAEAAKRGGKAVTGKVWSHATGTAVASRDLSRVAKSRNAIAGVAAAALASSAAVGASSMAGQKTKAQTYAKYGW